MKKKLVFIVLNGKPYGGSEKHVYDLASSRIRSEYDMYIITSIGNKLAINALNKCQIIEISRGMAGIFKLVNLLNQLKPDIIHAHAGRAITITRIALIFIKLFRNKPFIHVSTYHGLWLPKAKSNSFYKWLQLAFSSFDERVITVSEKDGQYLLEKNLKYKSFTIIHNGIDLENFRRYYTTRTSVNKIGFFGRLSEQKGFDILAKLIPQIPDKYEIVIYGEGQYEEKAVELGRLFNNVSYLGFSSEPQVVLASFDILIAPSRNEGLPYAFIEAGAVGLPVITYDVGGVSEVIEHKKNGYFMEGNEISDLLNAIKYIEENISELSENAYNKSKEFSIDLMISKTKGVYEN